MLALADGRITILVTGYCAGTTTDHAFILTIALASRSALEKGGGACSFAYGVDVREGDLVPLEAEWNPSVASTFYGTVLVLFQPE